jgi:hypothetical protein
VPDLAVPLRRSWSSLSIVFSPSSEFDHEDTRGGITGRGVSPRLYRRIMRRSGLYHTPSWHEYPGLPYFPG